MDLDEFVRTGWQRHGDDAQGVFDSLPEGIGLVQQPGQVPQLAGLIVHVAGEHLGEWEDGLGLLRRLGEVEGFDPDSAEGRSLRRSRAVLHHCAGDLERRDQCLANAVEPDLDPNSGRVRVLCIAASALLGQKRVEEAAAAFREALGLAHYGPGADDPAARALAVTGNNLACELEDAPERDAEADALLLTAAQAARRYWEVAGTWVNVERAEYRLAMTQLALGDAAQAFHHAQVCLNGCLANDADGVEFFFAHEALAKSALAMGHRLRAEGHRTAASEQLDRIEAEGMHSYCEGELGKLDALLAG